MRLCENRNNKNNNVNISKGEYNYTKITISGNIPDTQVLLYET